MKEKIVYNFEYKGIRCEVVHWGVGESYRPEGVWNGYIYILEANIPNRFKELLCKYKKTKLTTVERKFWNYYTLDNIFEMVGGITYYELLRDEFSGKKKGIKVGNDYIHSWDEGRHYNEEQIKYDLEKSVDSFISHFPDYLVWNPKNGEYISPKDFPTQSERK